MSAAEFSHKLRVYIEDTDAGGIVYYVNYLKFMERARTEFMRTLGYRKSAIFDSGLMFVVRDMAVNYRLPARLDDELEATARMAITNCTVKLAFHTRSSKLNCSSNTPLPNGLNFFCYKACNCVTI